MSIRSNHSVLYPSSKICFYFSLLGLPQPMWMPKWEICSIYHQRIAVLNKQFGRELTEIGLAISTIQSLNSLLFKCRIRHNSPGICHCSALLNHNTALSITWVVTSLSMFVVEVLPHYDTTLNISYAVSGFRPWQNTACTASTRHCPEYNLHSKGL